MKLDHRTIPTNGVELHVALAGSEDGIPVFLLHGFPDAWFGWEKQLPALAEAGFRVIVPDQRGYNLSSKPGGISSYRMDTLAADILGLADHLGLDRFHLAGHDFGAAVSWHIAARHPERLRRLAIANVPHPAVMVQTLRRSPAQLLKSWYMFFFQIPRLPEWSLQRADFQTMAAALSDVLTEADLDRYRSAWAQPGAITAMLNWYRAALRFPGKSDPAGRISTPTLILWGKKDRFLGFELVAPTLKLCDDARLETFPDASHWVLQERPELINPLLIAHFQGDGIRS